MGAVLAFAWADWGFVGQSAQGTNRVRVIDGPRFWARALHDDPAHFEATSTARAQVGILGVGAGTA